MQTRPADFSLAGWVGLALAAVAALGAASCARGATLSGVYVGASAGRVEFLQIVQTSDGRLTGRVEEVTLTDAGAIQDNAMALDGAVDGQQITLAPKSGFIAAFGGSLTGLVAGDRLDLSWQGGHSVLTRSNINSFEADVAALRKQAAQIVADREARDAAAAKVVAGRNLLSLSQQVSQGLDALEAASPGVVEGLSRVDAQYASLALAAQHKRAQQASFAATGGQGVAAMGAGTDAQGLVVQIDGIHGAVNGARGRARDKVAEILSGISAIEAACQTDPLLGQTSDPCPNATEMTARLKRIAAPLHEAFEKAEGAYADAVATAHERPHGL